VKENKSHARRVHAPAVLVAGRAIVGAAAPLLHAALSTVMQTIGGIRYIAAAENPRAVEEAEGTTRVRHWTNRALATAPQALVVLAVLLIGGVTPAYAADKDLNTVINGIRNWAMGILLTLTTLYLTVAGIRYILAGGSPHAMEEAKTAVRNSLFGYALAALAPLLADIVKGIVG